MPASFPAQRGNIWTLRSGVDVYRLASSLLSHAFSGWERKASGTKYQAFILTTTSGEFRGRTFEKAWADAADYPGTLTRAFMTLHAEDGRGGISSVQLGVGPAGVNFAASFPEPGYAQALVDQSVELGRWARAEPEVQATAEPQPVAPVTPAAPSPAAAEPEPSKPRGRVLHGISRVAENVLGGVLAGLIVAAVVALLGLPG